MNPTKVKIKDYLDSLPVDLLPLRNIGKRYLKYCSSIDIDGCIQIAHRPWQGCLNYALASNGVFAFGFSLFGLAPSMQKKPPLLDRSKLQCLDLSLANCNWIREYDVDQRMFHFGGRHYSYTENIGYFMSEDSLICAFRKTGGLHRKWRSFSSFLSEELKVAEQNAHDNSENHWLDRGDGSEDEWRTPIISWSVIDVRGNVPVPDEKRFRCGNQNALQSDEVFRLAPGETEQLKWVYLPPFTKPGVYRGPPL